jgi:hypothetical protein
VTNKARSPSCLHTIFLALCSPTCMNQCGTFSTSTHYRRKHLESRGFDMRWQEGVISNNRSDGKEERECRRAAENVVREGGEEAARASTTPQDAVAAKDETYCEANSPSHEGTHFHFLPDRWLSTVFHWRGHFLLDFVRGNMEL